MRKTVFVSGCVVQGAAIKIRRRPGRSQTGARLGAGGAADQAAPALSTFLSSMSLNLIEHRLRPSAKTAISATATMPATEPEN